MPKNLRASLAFAALGLAAMAAAPEAAPADQSSFSFSISGIHVGQMSLGLEQSGDRYDASTRIDTAGIVGVFADFFFDGAASGNIVSGGEVVPQLFTATSKSPRALRHSRIEWKNGTPVKVSVEPPRDSSPDPADQTGTLDPVSAGVRLLRDAPANEICDTTILVYDGSRLSRLKVAAPREKDERLICDGTYARLKGEASSLVGAREFPFSITFVRRPDGTATLERIEAPTDFGQAIVARVD